MITFWIACFLWGCFSASVFDNRFASLSVTFTGVIGLIVLRKYGL